MTSAPVPVPTNQPTRVRPRLWPVILIVLLGWLMVNLARFVPPDNPLVISIMFLGPVAVPGLFVLWWLFFSRVPWLDRFLLLGSCAAVGAVACALADPTIGFLAVVFYGVPILMTAWVGWLLLSPFLSWPVRRGLLMVVIAMAWAYVGLLRFDGVTGSFQSIISWRWAPTAEQKFLAEHAGHHAAQEPAGASSELKLEPGDWPGFRGANRDAKLTGVRIVGDWNAHPPRQLWRKRVGPGWSSFTVIGDHVFTQEQRGEEEVVVCYDANTGDERWVHQDQARFTEPIAGPGPRATPTFHAGKLYVQGARGTLNCLDAATGKRLWSRDILTDAGVDKPPEWGYAASPFVHQDVVTVFGGGGTSKSVLGYNAATGELAWTAGDGKLSYCSTQLATIGGVAQLLLTSDLGLTAFDPAKGTLLWTHEWPMDKMARVTQPAVLDSGGILIGSGFGFGTRLITVGMEGNQWKDEPVWTSKAIKPYYNDLVVHQGYLYGFDNSFFTCVGLQDGKGQWRTRGYGNGQVLLIADQNLLLILSETGEAALVEATPDGHKVVGKFQAIQGKTWNHPVIAHGKLFVRNGEEMACYQLELEK